MAAIQKTFAKDSVIFHEGDNPTDIYIIKKGTISIRKRKMASFVEVAKIYQNEVLGEMSFFDRKPRSASAVCLSEVEVLEIPFEGLDKMYAGMPDYFKSIIASVVERLRKANTTIRKLEDGQKSAIAMDLDADLSEDEMNKLIAENTSGSGSEDPKS